MNGCIDVAGNYRPGDQPPEPPMAITWEQGVKILNALQSQLYNYERRGL